jgi:hypothetical protein
VIKKLKEIKLILVIYKKIRNKIIKLLININIKIHIINNKEEFKREKDNYQKISANKKRQHKIKIRKNNFK